MIQRVLISGFGGQGILLLGKLLAQAAMENGLEVTFFPSYGAEVRGGTAKCHVIISDEPIYSPHVVEADALVVMNQPSYDRFRTVLKPDGWLLLNSSMAKADDAVEAASPANRLLVPATETANELGNVRVANTVMLGAFATVWSVLQEEAYMRVLEAGLAGRKAHLLDVNRQAYRKGAALAAELCKGSS